MRLQSESSTNSSWKCGIACLERKPRRRSSAQLKSRSLRVVACPIRCCYRLMSNNSPRNRGSTLSIGDACAIARCKVRGGIGGPVHIPLAFTDIALSSHLVDLVSEDGAKLCGADARHTTPLVPPPKLTTEQLRLARQWSARSSFSALGRRISRDHPARARV